MKKNILLPEIKHEVVSRINKITAQSERQWGKMNVSQMLMHQNEAFMITYGEILPKAKPKWLVQKLMRWMILDTDIPAPKGKAQTFLEIDEVLKGADPDFETEKKRLLDHVNKFPTKELYHSSPLLGKMSKENWGRLMYTHLDHHLRQFGA